MNPYLGDFSGQQIGGDQVTYSGTYFQRPMPFPQYQMPQQQNFLRPQYGRRLGRFTPYLEQAQPFLGIE